MLGFVCCILSQCDLWQDDIREIFDETMDLFPNLVDIMEPEKDATSSILWLPDETSEFESTPFQDNLNIKLLDEFEKLDENDSESCLSPSSDVDSKDKDTQSAVLTKEYRERQSSSPTSQPPDSTISTAIKGPKVIQIIRLTQPQHVDQKKETSDCQSLSKNAIAARENRIRKKKYIQELEATVAAITSENTTLKTDVQRLETVVGDLEAEVKYLRNVLENVDEISSLIKAIRSTSGSKVQQEENGNHERPQERMNTRASLKRKLIHDDGESISNENSKRVNTLPAPKTNVSKESSASQLGGVCLHVNKGQMSLEFCARCSGSAVATWHTQSR